jgi:hypothetical protein
MDTLPDVENWPSIKIGSHDVIRHAYQNVLNACARLASFATSVPITTDGPIERQQELLAADDLVTFGIHARRLIENTTKAERFTQVTVRHVSKSGEWERIKVTRIINILIHHKDIYIITREQFKFTRDPEEMFRRYLYYLATDRHFPAIVSVTSDRYQTISFQARELVETFQVKILNPIIDLCAEQDLFLEDLDS